MRRSIRNTFFSGLTAIALTGCQTPDDNPVAWGVDIAENVLEGRSPLDYGKNRQTVIIHQPAQAPQQQMQNIYGSSTLQGWPNWQYIQNPVFGNVVMAAGKKFVDLNGDRAVSPGELQEMSKTFSTNGLFTLACRFDKNARNVTIYGYDPNGNLMGALPQPSENGINSLVSPLNVSFSQPGQGTFVVKGYLYEQPPRWKGFNHGPGWKEREKLCNTESVIGILQLNFE